MSSLTIVATAAADAGVHVRPEDEDLTLGQQFAYLGLLVGVIVGLMVAIAIASLLTERSIAKREAKERTRLSDEHVAEMIANADPITAETLRRSMGER